MKKTPLTNSRRKAKIDDEDYALVSQFQWHLTPDGEVATHINGDLVLLGQMVLFPELADGVEGHN